MKHIVVLNLTAEKLDSSFSLVAEMTGATVTIGWKDGAPDVVSNPENSTRIQQVAIPVIANFLRDNLKGFSLEQIMQLEFVVVGGCDDIKFWITYLCGRWNITCTFWYEKTPQSYVAKTIRPQDNDAVFSAFLT